MFLLIVVLITSTFAITPSQEKLLDEMKETQRLEVDTLADKLATKQTTAVVQHIPRPYSTYFQKMMNTENDDKPLNIQSRYSKPIKHSHKKVGHVLDEIGGSIHGRHGFDYAHTRDVKTKHGRSYSKSSVSYYTSDPSNKNFANQFFQNKDGDLWF
ncbi:hypothetical protein EIN_498440 [Entamoeba invadens IP1]|uniref:Uncharacterized protein n=1 Tax=Entamoeba invadens IP1 TaxID=370355 RepID=A0A0A1UDX1_ENTIV|nr:hypothetical protein EIN_498440 [Entamoeba invadens IP1]ELP94644.1 hypothetical protein EIN_498440 [Entamoeba invadens IP1]|eukprot:XP_004261415.1 hypothetical protein EIN_498440 [Entamoeba invadens IP1]